MKIPAEGHVEVVKYSHECPSCRLLGLKIKHRDRNGAQRTYGPVYRNDHGSRCQEFSEKCLDCGHEALSTIDYDCLAGFFPAK